MPLTYRSTKTWPHAVGLSCAFRQWRAESHCRFMHGYALSVRVEFEADQLDERNWVVDFGGLKTFKAWLEATFDHKTLVAADDPDLEWFTLGASTGVIDLLVVPATGCEAFARLILERAEAWLAEHDTSGRCRVARVELREHDGNGAIVERTK
ncbi:6-carboxytetrahydropterin synthase [Parvibaculum sp.]|uniref:6-pyruvoyl trahydropterin synthase family protein n=1 Tax=Parvibaculum sp. TaxID=2024848 RepID=UPI001E0A33DF|nr:6-carboxytetrahydropterin synthase [Parvibaculum sp.]MBX3490889.1 6-carboxytetrahydropterin synthase [Parvibaculum sp.]